MDDRARQLEREEMQRQRVAISSVLAGVLLFAGSLYGGFAIESKTPSVGLVQGLAPALHGQPRAAIDPHTQTVIFVDHHAVGLVLATLIIGLGTVLMVLLLRYLYYAARLRRPGMGNVPLVFATAGPVLAAVMSIASQVVAVINAHTFVKHTDVSHHAVQQAINSGARVALGSIATAGQLAVAVAFVMISLNAMRVGLVTKMIGWLGVISGILFVIPVLSPLPLVQTFWLVGMGVILGRWAGNPLPPAWEAGEARPWPTPQEMREARDRQRAGGRAVAGRASAPPPAPVAPSQPSPATSKKRKRRRR